MMTNDNAVPPAQPQAAAPAAPLTFLGRNPRHLFKVGIEPLAVFIGVTAAFAFDNWRSEAAAESYRRQMITSLPTSIDRLTAHNVEMMSTNAATLHEPLATSLK